MRPGSADGWATVPSEGHFAQRLFWKPEGREAVGDIKWSFSVATGEHFKNAALCKSEAGGRSGRVLQLP